MYLELHVSYGKFRFDYITFTRIKFFMILTIPCLEKNPWGVW